MKERRGILGIVFLGLLASTASAEEICPQLSKLIKDPPAGFLAERGALVSPQRWAASQPFLANSKCVLWASRSAEAHEIRCTVNNRADPSLVAAFYEDTKGSIERCLAGLPEGNKYARKTEQVDGDGLKGAETRWEYRSDALRFLIELTNYRRTADGSAYNDFSVEYLKY